MAVENLTTYVEVDQNSDITITSNKVAFDTLTQGADSYVYKDFDVGYFNDFIIEFESEITFSENISIGNVGQAILFAVSNTIGSFVDFDTANDGIIVDFYNLTDAENDNSYIRIRDFSNDNSDTLNLGSATTIPLRYFRISRSDTTCTCEIFSDSDRTILVDTLSITCETDGKRYLYALSSRNSGINSSSITGYNQNFEITYHPESTFSTDFSKYTLNEQPSGWTERWYKSNGSSKVEDNESLFGGKSVVFGTDGSDSNYALTWDDIGQVSDIEILSLVRTESSVNGANRIIARLTDGLDNVNAGYYVNMQYSSNNVQLYKHYNANYTDIGNYGKTLNALTWYWIRFRIENNSLKVSVWEYNTEEPGSWQIDVTDNDLSSGYVGIGTNRLSVGSGCSGKTDYFAADTNSSTWPLVLPSVSEVNVSPNVGLQSLSLAQYSSTVNAEVNITKAVNLLNKSLAQYVSTVLISNPNVTVNLNILQRQITINELTLDIINKLVFPIVFPITGGLTKSYKPNPITGGLTKSYKPNPFIKGIEIVKR